jgi:nucleoside-diphosphate-sugar epimerase
VEWGTQLLLVTGAAGWTGQRLVESLILGLHDSECLSAPQPGLRVRCLVLPGQRSVVFERLSAHVEVVEGDLRRPEDCARFCADARGAIVFHTAGVIHPSRVREFNEVNVEGTKGLLSAAAAAGIRRAVVVSSNSPCGCNPSRTHRFDESSRYHPYMNYGRSKMLMEQAVHAVQKEGRLETVIVRPPWFYGPYQPPRQSLFFRMIRDGKAPIVGDGNNLRSMCYIDNLCQGLMLAALTAKASGQTYWIADERPYSMNEIIDTVEKCLETEFGIACAHKRLRLPGLASEFALVADAVLQAVGVYHQKIHVLSEMNKTIACAVDRARTDLGYQPRIALEEGMRRSIRWVLDTQGKL